MRKTAFYYSQLPDQRHKDLYIQVLKSIREGKNTATIEKAYLKSEDITQVRYALDYDYPELFYVRLFGEGAETLYWENGKIELRFKYLFSPAEQQQKINETKGFIRYILSHIPTKVRQNQYETVLWLHDTLCKNLAYNYDAKEKGSEEIPEAYCIVGGMRDKRAVCSGITKLFQMLCEQEGIWCTYVAGVTHLTKEELEKNVEGSTGRHAWNLVRVNNTYAYIDTTWDLKEKSEHIWHTYFGMSTEECLRTRDPDQKFSSVRLPVCKAPNPLNYYVYKKLRFRSFAELEKYVEACVKKKEKNLFFQIDPQGLDHLDISDRTQKFMKNYLYKKASEVQGWKWTHNDTMMTFEYSLEYRNS